MEADISFHAMLLFCAVLLVDMWLHVSLSLEALTSEFRYTCGSACLKQLSSTGYPAGRLVLGRFPKQADPQVCLISKLKVHVTSLYCGIEIPAGSAMLQGDIAYQSGLHNLAHWVNTGKGCKQHCRVWPTNLSPSLDVAFCELCVIVSLEPKCNLGSTDHTMQRIFCMAIGCIAKQKMPFMTGSVWTSKQNAPTWLHHICMFVCLISLLGQIHKSTSLWVQFQEIKLTAAQPHIWAII